MKTGFVGRTAAPLRVVALAAVWLSFGPSARTMAQAGSQEAWSHGPPTNANFFPLGVWLQSPANATRYRAAGFNTYIGLWRGPTEAQLEALRQAGMRVICEQNEAGLRAVGDPTIIGWMHGDEPDNAQEKPGGGYGPPVPPEKIVESYRRLRAADPSRPVLLNLGQGVAWDQWYGRGVRSNHPEDYPAYVQGADIVSFDIYPVVHDHKDVAGKLDYVARGVERLVRWTEGRKVVWNCLECTRISNPERKPTPHEVRAEAWMSLIHGSRGLIYFVHQFKPVFREAALLDDAAMLDGVTSLNRQITELAAVLNAPAPAMQVRAETDPTSGLIDTMVRRQGGSTYLFAVEMRGQGSLARFRIQGRAGEAKAVVLGEDRVVSVNDGQFPDRFGPWEVHLYRLAD
jgi:hypothetical protein